MKRLRRLATAGAGALLFSLVTVPTANAVPTVVAVAPTADTYTSASAPTTDFGTSGSLAVYGSPDITTVLRFQFPAIPAGQVLTGASLRLRTTSLSSAGSANTLNVRTATDTWSETGTFYANRPAVSGPTLGSLPGGTVPNTAYDITLDASQLTGWTGSRTLSVTGTGTDSTWFWSRQASASLRPVLNLTYTDTAPPDTTAPSAPTALSASVTGTTIALTWTAATDDVAVTGYTVHRSSTPGFTPGTSTRIADTTTTSYSDQNRPAGTWYYRTTARDAAGNTSTSSNEATATITPPPTGGSATVLAVGDIACAPGAAVTSSTCRHGDVASLVASTAPDRFIALGDLQYQNGTLAEFMGSGGYNDAFGAFKAITLPALGNHEYGDNTRGYFDYFYGTGVSSGPFGARQEGYYATTIGAWTFIALNSECDPGRVTGGCGVGSPQYLWLQDRLTNSPTACTLVATHHPRWSTGLNHGSYPELGPMWDLMAAHGVDVMISAHNHVSEIFRPIGASGSGTPVLSDTGIRSFTAGGGGADLQSLTPNSDPLLTALVARNRGVFGPLKLILNEGSYSWQFLPVPGMTFTNFGTTGSFSGSDTCH